MDDISDNVHMDQHMASDNINLKVRWISQLIGVLECHTREKYITCAGATQYPLWLPHTNGAPLHQVGAFHVQVIFWFS